MQTPIEEWKDTLERADQLLYKYEVWNLGLNIRQLLDRFGYLSKEKILAEVKIYSFEYTEEYVSTRLDDTIDQLLKWGKIEKVYKVRLKKFTR